MQQRRDTMLVVIGVSIVVLLLIGLPGVGMLMGPGMMGVYGGYGPWWGLLMLLFWALLIGGVALLAIWVVPQGTAGAPDPGGGDRALDILRERYAREDCCSPAWRSSRRARRPAPGRRGVAGAWPGARHVRCAGGWLFRTGTRPDGQPVPFAGVLMMRATCADCHGADGRGRRTALFTSPDIASRNRTDPAGMREPDGARGALIGRAITAGLDAGGEPLARPMPRRQLSDREVADLPAYLRTLP